MSTGLERLEYEIKYGPVVLGSMVMEYQPEKRDAGDTLEHLTAQIEIDRALSFVFWANYQLESWCRKDDRVTVRSYKRTREKNYRSEWWAEYFPDHGFVHYSDGYRFPLSDSARDMLSLWFYLRSLQWGRGDSRVVNAHIDRRNWRVCFVVTGTQNVRTPLGDFNCLVISPRTNSPLGAVFLSQDRNRVPVVIRTRIGSFTVSAYLKRIERR
jgi:hypothetical protein